MYRITDPIGIRINNVNLDRMLELVSLFYSAGFDIRITDTDDGREFGVDELIEDCLIERNDDNAPDDWYSPVSTQHPDY